MPQLTWEMHFGRLGRDVCDAPVDAEDDTSNDDGDEVELLVTKWQLWWAPIITIFSDTENNSFSVTFKLNSYHKNIP